MSGPLFEIQPPAASHDHPAVRPAPGVCRRRSGGELSTRIGSALSAVFPPSPSTCTGPGRLIRPQRDAPGLVPAQLLIKPDPHLPCNESPSARDTGSLRLRLNGCRLEWWIATLRRVDGEGGGFERVAAGW